MEPITQKCACGEKDLYCVGYFNEDLHFPVYVCPACGAMHVKINNKKAWLLLTILLLYK